MVQFWLDGSYHQDVIVGAGPETDGYERLLGELGAGTHRLEVRDHPGAPRRAAARLLDLTAGPVEPRDADEAFAWRHAPWIYTRAEQSPWESLWTDSPLFLFYRLARTVVEYQCVFSNEDGGTDTRGLLAQWGRTVDIEWVLALDRQDGAATIQGRGHHTEVHSGHCVEGRRTLQVVGLHGMVCSRPPTGALRCLFLPRVRWDDRLPRETVLDAHPWCYRVAALEMLREGKLDATSPAEEPTPGDLRDYLYVQLFRRDGPGVRTGVEIEAQLADGRTYSSTHGALRQACFRASPFSTAVKLPRGGEPVALRALAHAAPGSATVQLGLHRAFRLDAHFLPLPPLAAGGPWVELGPDRRVASLWLRDGRG